MEYLLNRLTLLYSEIYYKEENYLKVKTIIFKYITPPILKVEYISMLSTSVHSHIPIFSHSHVLNFLLHAAYITQLTPYPIALLVPSVPYPVY